jgi:hypothetical protein
MTPAVLLSLKNIEGRWRKHKIFIIKCLRDDLKRNLS